MSNPDTREPIDYRDPRTIFDIELNQWGVEVDLHPVIYQHLLDGLVEILIEERKEAKLEVLGELITDYEDPEGSTPAHIWAIEKISELEGKTND